MRLGLLAFALAACSSSASARPAWPKQTPPATDGGESLAPHAAARTIAAVTASSDDDDSKPVDPTASAPAAPSPAATSPAPAIAPVEEEPPITEEIVIEVGD